MHLQKSVQLLGCISKFLTRLLKSFIGVFCNDFATVDVREELCYHSRPKKQIRRGDAIDCDVVYFLSLEVFNVFKKITNFFTNLIRCNENVVYIITQRVQKTRR